MPRGNLSLVLGLVAALCLSAAPGFAQDADTPLARAIALGTEGDWAAGRAALDRGDSLSESLFDWTRLRDGDGTFAEARSFLDRHPTWPGLSRIIAQSERALPDDMPPEAVIATLDRADLPETGVGVLKLATAFQDAGRDGDAGALLAHAWLTLSMDEDAQTALAEAFPDILRPLHADRADMLLWRWKRSEAEALVPFLDDAQAALVTARIALIRGDRDVSPELAEVPDALQDAPGLLYDRYSWHAAKGQRTAALALLEAASESAEGLQEPFRWAGWRRTLARWVLREGEPERAYSIAARHWLMADDGVAFVDLEWLAGYIALRHLDQPQAARVHFQSVATAASSPITQARAQYWLGRTAEALSDPEAAQAAYAAGAEHQTTFYGLLSAERIGRPFDAALATTGNGPAWTGTDVMRLEKVQAGIALLNAGQRGAAVLFFRDLGLQLEARQLEVLGQYLMDREEAYYALLLGKVAQRRGITLPRLLHPIHDLARRDLPVQPALSLAVARQESEFRADAGSPVGALGLMQLMPATAQEVAGELDLPYSRARLTSDWEYNADLGAKYLANLQGQFGPSPVMIAAGYNAGPSRPEIWMDERGDPRVGDADIIDWIEMIPFRETRNYVMRVTEAIPVYRARLGGPVGPVRFTQLLIGEKPLVRPVARPDRSEAPAVRPVARSDG